MALLFSAVRVTAGDNEGEFLAVGISKELYGMEME